MTNAVKTGRPCCYRGHPYVEGSFFYDKHGHKCCRQCHKIRAETNNGPTFCSECGKKCHRPYSRREPLCRNCRLKATYRMFRNRHASLLGAADRERSPEEQAIISEHVIIYEYRYDRGLDLYTGKPLPPEDFVENNGYVRP